MSLLTKKSYPVADLWDDFFDSSRSAGRINQERLAPVDVTADDKNIYVRVELPGVKKEDVHVNFEDGILSITGTKHETNQKEDQDVYYKETYHGEFQRRFTVGRDVNFEQANASLKEGVLNISLPKAKQSAQKKLNIN